MQNVPKIEFGSMPNDDGNLLLSPEEKNNLIKAEPEAMPYIKKLIGSEEFLNGIERYCLWLKDIPPEKLKLLPNVYARVEKVKEVRLKSKRKTTQYLAMYPSLFGEIRQPKSDYMVIPEVSSERRNYIPLGFIDKEIITTNKNYTISSPTLYDFGVLSSAMHMGWTRTVCGRLKSDYQYSAGIVYNNFPWPESVTEKQKQNIENAAQAILDARSMHTASTLAVLYDPIAMPPELVIAHQKLDFAVDAAYSKRKFYGDSDRVSFLFDLYNQNAAKFELNKKMGKIKGKS